MYNTRTKLELHLLEGNKCTSEDLLNLLSNIAEKLKHIDQKNSMKEYNNYMELTKYIVYLLSNYTEEFDFTNVYLKSKSEKLKVFLVHYVPSLSEFIPVSRPNNVDLIVGYNENIAKDTFYATFGDTFNIESIKELKVDGYNITLKPANE